jgi:hypothetical protein
MTKNVNENPPARGEAWPVSFLSEHQPKFKDMTCSFTELFQKEQNKGTLPNSFCEVSIALVQRRQKHYHKGKP